MRKIKNPWVGMEGYNCFGCNPNNEYGIKMEFYEDGEDIVSFWKPSQNYQSWINTLHGGILSTIVDEAAGWVVFRKLQTSGVTSRLEVKYKKPVSSLDPMLTVRARLKEMKRHVAFIDVTIENSMGELCVEGSAVYFTFPKEKAQEMGFSECGTESEELLAF